MRIFAGLMVIGFMIVGAGCSDPDVVPESHISAPPENPVSVEPETVEQFPLNTALFGDPTCTRVGPLTPTLVKTDLGPMRRIDLPKAKR